MTAYRDARQDEPVIRANALRIFRREYFHALRNGLDSDAASEQAFERVRAAFRAHPLIKPLAGIDREEAWGEILGVLVEWRMLLRDVPIDVAAIPPKGQIDAGLSGAEIPVSGDDTVNSIDIPHEDDPCGGAA